MTKKILLVIYIEQNKMKLLWNNYFYSYVHMSDDHHFSVFSTCTRQLNYASFALTETIGFAHFDEIFRKSGESEINHSMITRGSYER